MVAHGPHPVGGSGAHWDVSKATFRTDSVLKVALLTHAVAPGRLNPTSGGRPYACSAAYPGLMTSLMSASRSSKRRKADFIALTVNHCRSAQS